MTKLGEDLEGFSRPHLGQIVIWILIYIAITRTYHHIPTLGGERMGPVSMISFLPEEILSSVLIFTILRVVLLTAGVLWGLQLLLPFSGWLTVLSLTAVVAFYHENARHISHVFNMLNMVLLIHAMWYQFYHKEIRRSLANGTFWNSRIYPGWAFCLSVFYIGLYHTYAGVSKLVASGWPWVNGVSLQLWVYLFGREGSWLGELIVSNRDLATLLQAGALIVETAAILALFSEAVRLFFGIALLAFYFAVICTFGYQFEYNALIVALFFLPCKKGLDRLYESMRGKALIEITPGHGRFWPKLAAFLVHRIDLFHRVEIRIRPHFKRRGYRDG